jgi:hypothetical protein
MGHTSHPHGGFATRLGRWDTSARQGYRAGWQYQTASPAKVALFTGLVIWGLGWKAASLWRAAKDDSKPWFIVLFVSNTAGILDALYIFGVSAKRRKARVELRESQPD